MEFVYKRKKGLGHEYRVEFFTLINALDGSRSFTAKIYRGGDIVGHRFRQALVPNDPRSAEVQARQILTADIEDLVNITE